MSEDGEQGAIFLSFLNDAFGGAERNFESVDDL